MDASVAILKLKKPKLVREIEFKFGVPLYADIGSLVNEAEALARKNGWALNPREESNRSVRYFDVVETHILALRNQTIREVTKYDESGNARSIRYDYKTGTEKRFEANMLSPGILPPDKIFEYIPDGFYRDGESGLYKPLSFAANAETHHIKIGMAKEGTLLEVKFDHFKIGGDGEFRELEIELKKNNGIRGSNVMFKELVALFDSILSGKYSLFHYSSQKYTRVLFSLITPTK